ncbi:MmgE/PrpD family protein [Aliiroseovarius sp. PTFE2010]|uniref:MmgE/PrpD family protein n=1 Tax=Aliiroseovarius sp. PTFE2010 TaxID=3417190 RepID=UPI003CE85616
MIGDFTARLTQFVAAPHRLSEADAEQAALCVEDTVAVIYAGWHEPVVRQLAALDGDNPATPEGAFENGGVERATFLTAVAGHALDFDDVHTISVTHPSVVLVPALLAMAHARPDTAGRVASALAVGTAVNVALGQVLGFAHYDKGWHATSTIGPLAAAAAVAHQLDLDEGAIGNAVSLAASLAGGLQANFGTMAKPIQAGNAALFGLRAARMAEAGITGAPDIFAPRGFFDLYSGADGVNGDPAEVEPRIVLSTVSRKLYPCCYLTHRMIAAGRHLYTGRGGEAVPDGSVIEMTVPEGVMLPLHVTDPKDGMQAKFCAAYTLAVALHQGQVVLADFEGDNPHRPAVRRLMDMVAIETTPDPRHERTGVDHGTVHVRLRKGNATLSEISVAAHPGSPSDPATPAEIGDKIADCLQKYRRDGGVPPAAGAFRQDLRARLHLPQLRGAMPDGEEASQALQDKPEHGTSAANLATSERTT